MGNTNQSSSLSHEYKLRDNNHNNPVVFIKLKETKNRLWFQTQQYILFIFILATSYGHLTIIKFILPL